MTDGPEPLFPLQASDRPVGPPGPIQHSSYPQVDARYPATESPQPGANTRGPSPGPSIASGPSPLRRLQPKHWGLVGAAVAVIVIVAVGTTLLGDGDENTTNLGRDGTNRPTVAVQDVTPCNSPPTAKVESINNGAQGMTLSAILSSSCSRGDLLSNDRLRLTAFDGLGRDVAAGVFDLSSKPIAVPGDGGDASVEFIFPAGTYWRTPEATSGSVTLTAHFDGTDSAPRAGSSSSSVTAFDVGAPEHGSLDAAAYSALVDIASADRAYIDANLLEMWEPQLSSKRPGLFYEEITWQANDIVREHMQLRQRYPNARLVWSGDWPVYSNSDWWITLSGIPVGSGEVANDWCASQGYDADHCFAKMLSHRLGESGTTLNRN